MKDLYRFWGKARPASLDNGPDWHPLAFHWLEFSTVDFEGLLTVRDPAALLTAIGHGFGASKACDCGLILIRRA